MEVLSRMSILERFPWAKEKSIFYEKETEQNFDVSIKWKLNDDQLQLVVKLFEELEEWFNIRNRKIDIDIYYVGELFDRLHIDFSSNTREVFLIIEKYKRFSEELFMDKVDEEEDYMDIF
jgi:hypothetical protein